MIIQHNIMALNSYRQLGGNNSALAANLEKLSSGYRINRAADDAAGLAVSEKMRAQVRGLETAQFNASNGISLVQAAEGALAEIHIMLNRMLELSLQAANGIYDDSVDRKALNDEFQHLKSEIDRISLSTNFNGIHVFDKDIDPKIIGYVSDFSVAPIYEIKQWGELDFIDFPYQEFDRAANAERASVSVELSGLIDVNDIKSLEGKSISISMPGYAAATYTFTEYADRAVEGTRIVFSPMGTVEDAIKLLVNYARPPLEAGSVAIEHDPNTGKTTLTLTARLEDHVASYVDRGNQTDPYVTANGDGTVYNGSTVSSDAKTPLDTIGENGYPKTLANAYSSVAAASVSFKMFGAVAFPVTDTAAFNDNRITIASGGSTLGTISFTDNQALESPTVIYVKPGMTEGEMRSAIVDACHSISPNLSASWAGSGNVLTIEWGGLPTGTWNTLSVSEYYPPSTSVPIGVQAEQLGAATVPIAGTNESGGGFQVVFPQDSALLATDTPKRFSIVVNSTSYTYTLYNSDYPPAGALYNYPQGSYSIDVKGLTPAQIKAQIFAAVSSRAGSNAIINSGDYSVTYPIGGSRPTISVTNASNLTVNYTGPATGGGQSLLLNGTAYFTREVTAAFPDMPSDIPDGLVGKGFTVMTSSTGTTYREYEFCMGSVPTRAGATPIDISGAASVNDVIAIMNGIAWPQAGMTVRMENGVPVLCRTYSTSSSSASIFRVVDGVRYADGLLGASGVFSGGTLAGRPGTAVDFSSIKTTADVEGLIGKGFNITCATCEEEYINIIFCTDYLKEQILSSHLGGGNIYYLPVSVEGLHNGADVAAAIIEQLHSTNPNTGRIYLDHFADVQIGTPPTTILVDDKRTGDRYSGSGERLAGKIYTGILADFEIIASQKPIYADPDDYDDAIPLQIGDTADGYNVLMVKRFNMTCRAFRGPPNLASAGVGTYYDAIAAVSAIKGSIDRVSSVRAYYGSVQNRIEHTINSLSVSTENLASAESRIRDADMAKEMMLFTKNSLLAQSAQAMPSQANATLEGVLQLIK
ncbi:MAG: hypothetical protein FWG42_05850 [Clostridiales bacterium]|nr:hypothetical protein [Clostridiales bacterium]